MKRKKWTVRLCVCALGDTHTHTHTHTLTHTQPIGSVSLKNPDEYTLQKKKSYRQRD